MNKILIIKNLFLFYNTFLTFLLTININIQDFKIVISFITYFEIFIINQITLLFYYNT